jgi:hypothetical protein
MIAMLELPERPETLEYLWAMYESVSAGREYDGMMGARPISWRDIQAWREAMGRYVSPDEAQAMIALDLAVLHPPPAKHAEAEESDG